MPLSPNRLRRLVRQREQLETLQEGRLGQALRHETERRLALRDTESAKSSFLAEPAALGPVEPLFLATGSAYTVRLDREIGARRAALAHSATEVEVERDRLMDRRRDRRAMETLLEHRLAEQKLAATRTQAKRLDEQATIRWIQQRPLPNHPHGGTP